MIVRRWTFLWKSGKASEVMGLLKEGRDKLWLSPHAKRIYSPGISPGGAAVVEYEFENIEDMAAIMAQWGEATPEEARQNWFDRLDEVTRAGGSSEVWHLVE